jgi:hypothetical protein
MLYDRNDQFRRSFGTSPGRWWVRRLGPAHHDPYNLNNVADDHREVTADLAHQLRTWMRHTADPRAARPRDTFCDTSYYVGTLPP